jgi:hypothetical protein
MARITRMFGRYVAACEMLGLVPDGYRVGLNIGSVSAGTAYRVFLVGVPVEVDGVTTWPNGSGHGRPPAGDDYLGMTAGDAFARLADRAQTLEDVAYSQRQVQR